MSVTAAKTLRKQGRKPALWCQPSGSMNETAPETESFLMD